MKTAIAIPDSSLIDESTKLGKTQKISVLARICCVFKIDEIFIYNDANADKQDRILLATILKYLVTPPYFRKQLYPKMNLLKFAGALHPLKIPSHTKIKNPAQIKSGDKRMGIIVKFKGKKFFDVGIHYMIPYFGKEKIGNRVSLQFKTGYPNFSVKEIPSEQIDEYWGYKVQERSNLHSVISSWEGDIILTSRKGQTLKNSHLRWFLDSPKPKLIVFGSTEKGLHEFLGGKISSYQNSKILNFFPNQGTETVRLEEALMGTLSILNIARTGYI
ncbi:MAG: putative RNA uridine N3 methyltransferase [Nitrosopumilaceae archaeon]